jgi:hypothetical protein
MRPNGNHVLLTSPYVAIISYTGVDSLPTVHIHGKGAQDNNALKNKEL